MYQVGDLIAGYRVLGMLGHGGMGEVYQAAHPRLPRADAIKVLRSAHGADPVFRARFEREADIVAPLHHPNIVSVFDRGVVDGRLWIAMEFVAGTDAGQLIEEHGALDPRLVVQIVNGVAAGLDAAHRRGIMHRDIKPANILVTPGADPLKPEAIKLTDFGIAQALDEVTALTGAGTTVGTMLYSSPEQIEGKRVDARSDTYSLGATAFELLTGTPPFDAPSLHGLMTAHMFNDPPRATLRNPTLPPAVDAVLIRAIAKDPARRFQTAGDFAEAFGAAFDSRNTLVGPVPTPPPPPVKPGGGRRPSSPAGGPGRPGGGPGVVPARPAYSGASQGDVLRSVASQSGPAATFGGGPGAAPGAHVSNPRMPSAGYPVVTQPNVGVQPANPQPAARIAGRRLVAIGAVVVLVAAALGVGIAVVQRSSKHLAAPDRPDVTVATEYVEVSWNRVDGATSYVVKQNDIEIYAGAGNSFRAPLPLPGSYTYTVAARSDSVPGSDFSLRSDAVKVFLTWRGLQWIADLYPDLVPTSPLSTNGFDELSCSGDGGNLAFDTTEKSMLCHKRKPGSDRLDVYSVKIYGYADATEAAASARLATRRLRAEPYTTAQGNAATRYLDDTASEGGSAIVTFGAGPRDRTYLVVAVPGGSARDAAAVLARLPI
ncbi:serine/threonine-protein kinase [Gordonia sp. ABSL1-1]|uniref:serine/threonine-protein kinase n=1 Tax=Gordonia sp. ABSL1-1 TaxID=3053923 RepID=UPI002572F141|nr:serine/threonine-protein kinase [Gordonia sp. ABSL1-1]MDL9936526.1 serine/threonine-protein kinase [Gordonia sp. ABSL1-1]